MTFQQYLKKLNKATYKTIDGTEQELLTQYKRVLKKTNAEIAVYYKKYSKDGVLTMAEMSKYNRLQNLENSIFANIKEITGIKKADIVALDKTIINNTYKSTAYGIDKSVNAFTGFGGITNQEALKIINAPIGGHTLSGRLANDIQAFAYDIKGAINQGFIQGDSYQQTAKAIQGVFESDYKRAVRIARTEGNRIHADIRQTAFDEARDNGVELIDIWDATFDSKTRPVHKQLDGKERAADGYFHAGDYSVERPGAFGIAGQDINCRCALNAKIKGFEPETRYVRGVGEIKYMSISDYEKALANGGKGLKKIERDKALNIINTFDFE